MARQPNNRPGVPTASEYIHSVWTWILAVTAILGIILFLFVPLSSEHEAIRASQAVTITDVTDDAEEYYGQNVTVSGEVEQLIDSRAFTIGGQDFIGGNKLLIVSREQLPTVANRPNATSLAVNDIVQATGPLRQFDVEACEQEIDGNLNDQLFTEFVGMPVVIAYTLNITPRAISVATHISADTQVTVAHVDRSAFELQHHHHSVGAWNRYQMIMAVLHKSLE